MALFGACAAKYRDEILASIARELAPHYPMELLTLAAEWYDAQVQHLQGASIPLHEWVNLLVTRLRASGKSIHDVLRAVLAVRRAVYEVCCGKSPDLSNSDIAEILFDLVEYYIRMMGDSYAAAERAALTTERRRLRAVLEAMDAPCAALDPDGIILIANSRLAALVDQTPEGIGGVEFAALCDEKTATVVRRDLKPVRGGKRAVQGGSFRGTLKKNREAGLTLNFSIRPTFDGNGLRDGSVVALRNPFDNDAETMMGLRVIEQMARALKAGLFAVSAEGRVDYANTPDREFLLLGLEPGERSGYQAAQAAHGRFTQGFHEVVFSTGNVFHTTARHPNAEDQERWYEVICIPFYGEDSRITHVAKLVWDITAQKSLENQILRQQRTSLLTQLSMSLAHQLRNPLAVMIGFADLLSQGLPEEQQATAVEKILKNGIRCKQIVEGLFDFGQGLPDERKPVNINDIVRQRVQPMYVASLSGRLRWNLSDSMPLVECAEHPVAQVLTSLLDNALRVAKTTVLLETFVHDGAACISVTDDGPGIAQENRERIFEPFFSTWKEQGGIGLGLSLSKSVVREHGGRLYLDETYSEGARFVVSLPSIPSASPVVTGRKTAHALKSTARILIVEDEPDLSEVLVTTLRMRGFETEAALTAPQAISLMENGRYDLAVLDILLPGDIGGRELYQIMLGSNPELASRVMFMTADTMNFETRKFLEQSGRPFMEKPFMVDEFAGRVAAILKETSLIA